jgi:hypothetical protein
VHHCEDLVEMIETDILLAIFGARNEKILILQIKGEAHINSAMQGQSPTEAANGVTTHGQVVPHAGRCAHMRCEWGSRSLTPGHASKLGWSAVSIAGARAGVRDGAAACRTGSRDRWQCGIGA